MCPEKKEYSKQRRSMCFAGTGGERPLIAGVGSTGQGAMCPSHSLLSQSHPNISTLRKRLRFLATGVSARCSEGLQEPRRGGSGNWEF